MTFRLISRGMRDYMSPESVLALVSALMELNMPDQSYETAAVVKRRLSEKGCRQDGMDDDSAKLTLRFTGTSNGKKGHVVIPYVHYTVDGFDAETEAATFVMAAEESVRLNMGWGEE